MKIGTKGKLVDHFGKWECKVYHVEITGETNAHYWQIRFTGVNEQGKQIKGENEYSKSTFEKFFVPYSKLERSLL